MWEMVRGSDVRKGSDWDSSNGIEELPLSLLGLGSESRGR